MAPKTGAIFVLEVSLALQKRPPRPPPSGGRALQKSRFRSAGITYLPDVGTLAPIMTDSQFVFALAM
jgi:hypothetical protein